MSVDLTVHLGRLTLKNPIATASGTFGYGLEFAEFVDLSSLGAISVKGLSLRPCLGNPPPRICETDAGMLNAIGLQNVGIEEFLGEKLPRLHEARATVIANVWGDTEAEYRAVVERIGDDPRDQACKALAALAQRSARTPIEPHSVLIGVPDPHVGFHLEREARRIGGRIRAGVMSTVSDTDAFRTCDVLIAHAQERTLSTMRAAVLHPRVEAWVTERLIAHEEAGASRVARAMIRRGVLDVIDEYAKYAVHSSLDADFTTRKPELRWILGAVRDALDPRKTFA